MKRDPVRRRRRRRRLLLVLAVAGLLGVLGRSHLRTFLYSVYFLDGLSRLGQGSRLDALLAHPVERSRHGTSLADGEVLELDVYRPRGAGPWPALLIVPGFDRRGLEDPRMVALGQLLAGAGMVVALPELSELFEYRWSPRIAERIAAAFQAMAALPGVRQDRLGLFGLSISGGFAIAAATRPEIAERVHTLIAFAPYHDYSHLFDFVLTGRYRRGAQTLRRTPNVFSRYIFLYNYLHLALDPAHPQFAALREVIRLQIYEQPEQAEALAAGLEPQTRELLEKLESDELATLEPLARKAVEESRPASEMLSPHVNLCRLHGRLFVLHGSDDDIIPYSESLELAEHCKSCPHLRCDVLLTGLYGHADMDRAGQGAWHKLRYELPEFARYYTFLYRVLRSLLAE